MIFFLLSLVLFGCSLLIFLDLTIPLFWKISVAATEFGHWFFLLPLAIAVTVRYESPLAGMTSVLSLFTVALLLWPSFSASAVARSLSDRLERSFGPVNAERLSSSPFEWRRLWIGSSSEKFGKEEILYSTESGKTLRLLFYPAVSMKPAPCVIVFHTGGWDSGSPDEFESLNYFLASRGFAVAAVEYRFAPHYPWPAQKYDALAALEFLKTKSDLLGIDPSRFVLFGRSAGGQIAEATAYSANDPSIRGCIAFYSPADLNFAYEHLSPEPDILDSKTLLENFLGGSPSAAGSNYDDASSYNLVTANTPPTLLIHGRLDQLTWYRQSERLAARLSEHNVRNFYIELPWATHAFDFNPSGPGGQLSRFAVEWFLTAVTSD